MENWSAGWRATRPGWKPDRVPRHGVSAGQDFPCTWVIGHPTRHVRARRSPGGQARVLTVGGCLPSAEELDRALRSTGWGRWQSLAAAPGSYLTVFSDPDETVVFGDLGGATPVYYAVVDGGVLWSTAATPLAAYVRDTPDLGMLALDLSINWIPPYGGGTPYEHVRAVPPGWALRIGRDGCSVQRWCAPLPRATFDQTAAAIAGQLVHGVARRVELGSPISGDFGGTDSTILVALAARHVDTVGITYVDNPATTDVEHGKRVALAMPRLTRRLVPRSVDSLYYEGIGAPERLPQTDLPSTAFVYNAHSKAILEVALEAGSGHHLFGFGGDQALSSGPDTLVARLRDGRILSALALTATWARADRTSSWRAVRALAQGAVGGSYPRAVGRAASAIGPGAIDDRDYAFWELAFTPVRPTAAAGWVSTDAAPRVRTLAGRLAGEPALWEDPLVDADYRFRWRTSRSLDGYVELAAGLGIDLHAPWMDTELIRVSWALRGWDREPHEFKQLARAGLREVLPPIVTERTGKDRLGIARTSQEGLGRHAAQVRELVESSRLVAAGVLDRARVRRGVEIAVLGGVTAERSVDAVLAADLWLTRRPWASPEWWKEAGLCATERQTGRLRSPTTIGTSSCCRCGRPNGPVATPRSRQCGRGSSEAWIWTARSAPPRSGGDQRTSCAPNSRRCSMSSSVTDSLATGGRGRHHRVGCRRSSPSSSHRGVWRPTPATASPRGRCSPPRLGLPSPS
jgi:hypothetical protein